MITSENSRRQFLKTTGIASLGTLASAQWVNAQNVTPGSIMKHRFIIASDLHYTQKGTPFDKTAAELVTWVNTEKEKQGVDALFINGDLVQDSPKGLLQLRDKHLSNLKTPYYTTKGNHDFVDGKPNSPSKSWETIWGYPSNHTVKIGKFVFIIADTSAPAKSNDYRAVNIKWLKNQLNEHRDAPAIFLLIHIAQRRHKLDGWPAHGLHSKKEQPKGEAVMKLIESTPNVKAIFHGHNHKETSVRVSGKKQYFFDSHIGGSWGAKRGYRVIEIYDDHKMLTYQMNAEDNKELNRHDIRQPTQ